MCHVSCKCYGSEPPCYLCIYIIYLLVVFFSCCKCIFVMRCPAQCSLFKGCVFVCVCVCVCACVCVCTVCICVFVSVYIKCMQGYPCYLALLRVSVGTRAYLYS